MHIIIYKIYFGIVNRHFRKFATELQPLIDVRNQFLLNILRMNIQNLTKVCVHIIIDKIYIGIVNCHFWQVTAHDLLQNSVFVQYLERMNGQNLTKFCIHIIIDKIYVGIVN